jgi:hypothetical protein
MTAIAEHGIVLDLPGEWEPVESEEQGSLVYQETNGTDVVTVMLLRVKSVYAIADRTRLLSDYVQHRSQYERGQVPTLEQSDPWVEDRGGFIEAAWTATDPVEGRHQRHRALLQRDVLADFCFESSNGDSFDERAKSLLASAAISLDSPDAAE